MRLYNVTFAKNTFFWLKILHDLIKKGNLCRNFTPGIRKIKKINVETFNGLKELKNKKKINNIRMLIIYKRGILGI